MGGIRALKGCVLGKRRQAAVSELLEGLKKCYREKKNLTKICFKKMFFLFLVVRVLFDFFKIT